MTKPPTQGQFLMLAVHSPLDVTHGTGATVSQQVDEHLRQYASIAACEDISQLVSSRHNTA